MSNDLNKFILYKNIDEFEYSKNKSDLDIKFNRVAFIIFCFFYYLNNLFNSFNSPWF